MADTFPMIAKTFFGLEEVLADELRELGAEDVRSGRRMCSFRGDQRMLYWANIGCRTAVRILKPIARFPADGTDALYRRVGRTKWLKHLAPEGTLAIDPVTSGNVFTNSLYAAQVAKDAIVDQIRRATGSRPSVDLDDPDVRINLHIDGKRVTLYLDASGDSLHKRGYRQAAGVAPINEVLAAGILRLTGWDRAAHWSTSCVGRARFRSKPPCLRRIAPGTVRERFGYQRWNDFDPALHDRVLREARRQELPGLSFPIEGSDREAELINAARQNAQRAGVAADITWRVQDLADTAPPAANGTLITNPPYEERIKTEEIIEFHRRIGDVLKHRWAGYTAWILAGNREAAKFIGLKPGARIRLFNGPIECRLLKFAIYAFAPRPALAANRNSRAEAQNVVHVLDIRFAKADPSGQVGAADVLRVVGPMDGHLFAQADPAFAERVVGVFGANGPLAAVVHGVHRLVADDEGSFLRRMFASDADLKSASVESVGRVQHELTALQIDNRLERSADDLQPFSGLQRIGVFDAVDLRQQLPWHLIFLADGLESFAGLHFVRMFEQVLRRVDDRAGYLIQQGRELSFLFRSELWVAVPRAKLTQGRRQLAVFQLAVGSLHGCGELSYWGRATIDRHSVFWRHWVFAR